jgi:hypothetical protein
MTTEYRAANTDKGAITDAQGHTVFGRWEMDNGIERFVVAHYPKSKTYKTAAGAARAAAKWMAA